LGDLVFEYQIEDDHRDRPDDQCSKLQAVVAGHSSRKAVDPDRQRAYGKVAGQRQYENELIPVPQERIDEHRGDDGGGNGDDDFQEHLDERSPVDDGRLLHGIGNSLDVRSSKKHLERKPECNIGQDYPQPCVRQAQFGLHDEQRHDDRVYGNEQPQRIEQGDEAAALVVKLGEGIAAAHGKEHGKEGGNQRVNGAVDKVDAQMPLCPGKGEVFNIPAHRR